MRGLTSITRRRAVKLAAASAAAGAFGFAGRAEENILYVNSWGGSMEEAEVPAYFQPFTSKTGIRIRPVSPVSFAKLKAQVQSRHFEWDVSSTGKTDVQAAVHEGLLEPIDFSIVDRSKLAPDMIYGDPQHCEHVARDRTRLSQGPLPKWRAAELGGLLGRQAVSWNAFSLYALLYQSVVRLARRWGAY
jgi:hypothetical protein